MNAEHAREQSGDFVDEHLIECEFCNCREITPVGHTFRVCACPCHWGGSHLQGYLKAAAHHWPNHLSKAIG